MDYAKRRKHGKKQIRKAISKQLGYVRRDIRYLTAFIKEGCELSRKQQFQFDTICTLYEQQQYMFDNKTHSVPDRIVSLEQPWVRPIVRGKAKAPTEFGVKFDLSLDTEGFGRIEKISFDAYNEGNVLISAIERFRERTGCYPERVLADQIYRSRSNLNYCKAHHIRVSGPKLGRKPKTVKRSDRIREYRDNTDRIAVEREFSYGKRYCSLGTIMTRLQETEMGSVALSVLVSNLMKMLRRVLSALIYLYEIFEKNTVQLIPAWG